MKIQRQCCGYYEPCFPTISLLFVSMEATSQIPTRVSWSFFGICERQKHCKPKNKALDAVPVRILSWKNQEHWSPHLMVFHRLVAISVICTFVEEETVLRPFRNAETVVNVLATRVIPIMIATTVEAATVYSAKVYLGVMNVPSTVARTVNESFSVTSVVIMFAPTVERLQQVVSTSVSSAPHVANKEAAVGAILSPVSSVYQWMSALYPIHVRMDVCFVQVVETAGIVQNARFSFVYPVQSIRYNVVCVSRDIVAI